MSDFHAIGGVSQTLRALLLDRMELPSDLPLNQFRVTIGPPRSESSNPLQTAEPARVNLFLYCVTENGSLKNQQIPGHGNASTYGHPPLSLDLHYLVTAYGSSVVQATFQETLSHYLLGSAMRVFHDHAIVDEALLSVRDPIGRQLLESPLRDEYERVKLSLEPISLEDLTKVWTALTQPYRVSVAYLVSVVQIESRRQPRFPRRVQEPPAGPQIVVVPFRYPRIRELAVRWQETPTVEKTYPYARIGDTLILKGTNLGSARTRVKIGELEIPVGLTRDQQIELVVPDHLLPDGTPIAPDRRLQPGPQTVEVLLDTPELPASGFGSNQAVFMLTPRLTAAPAVDFTTRTLTLTGTRLFHPELRGETALGRAIIPSSAYSPATDSQIAFRLPDTLVAFPVPALLSGAIIFPIAPDLDDLEFTIGSEGPRTVFPTRKPTNAAEAAGLLQTALRISTDSPPTPPGPGFRGVRVSFTTDNRLVIVSGGLIDAIAVNENPFAQAMGLTPASGAEPVQVFLSEELVPFPVVRAARPQFLLTIGAIVHPIVLPGRPTDLDELIAWLQSGIRSYPEAVFLNARVTRLGSQILLLPGAAGLIRFDPVGTTDPRSVFELGLARRTPVRVRVNGAESIADVSVDLTT